MSQEEHTEQPLLLPSNQSINTNSNEEPGHVKKRGFTENFIFTGIFILCWGAHYFDLGIFFSLGILVLYKYGFKIRSVAFQALFVQILVYSIFLPMEIYNLLSDPFDDRFSLWFSSQYTTLCFGTVIFTALIFYIDSKVWKSKYAKLSFALQLQQLYKKKIARVYIIALVAFLAWLATELFMSLKDQYKYSQAHLMKWKDFIILFNSAFFSLAFFFGHKKPLFFLRKIFLNLRFHNRYASIQPPDRIDRKKRREKLAYTREMILPGWGQIYIGHLWKGYPILFSYLLILLFFISLLLLYIDPIYAIRFLYFLGLKNGIPDKELFKFASYIYIPITFFLLLAGLYVFSWFTLKSSLNEKQESDSNRHQLSLKTGFNNNLPISFLLHLILVTLIYFIPLSIKRSSNAEKKGDQTRSHFEPEKIEFYFIDPNIPDEVKDLNGGVISGNDTVTKEDGEKITNEKPKDVGDKVRGKVRKIKGKKLPKTYSNYISAKMRGPENFMEYWRRSPRPYSSVVAYTITTEGEIIDIEMVETSDHPNQDRMTLELIESLSPVMPPPGVKGDVRVTELFWNGPIDPDAMPTPLQKEMVLFFDGRYMEELN